VRARRGEWSVERRVETARTLHGPWPAPGDLGHRAVGLCAVTGPRAVVLGSTQADAVVDRARAERYGVDIVRRSSGGGAVLVGPGAQVWLDVWLPRHDTLWDDDVIASSWWLGETWASALESLGSSSLAVHRGRAVASDWSATLCFAGVGPGEVTTGLAAKVVGIAQRRTRHGARWHSMAVLSWQPVALVELLARPAPDDDTVKGAGPPDAWRALDDVAIGVRGVVPAPLADAEDALVIAAVEDALLGTLL
jgi:lipoate---protein ligase